MNNGDGTRHVVVSGQTLAKRKVKRLATSLYKCDDDNIRLGLEACLFMVCHTYIICFMLDVDATRMGIFLAEFGIWARPSLVALKNPLDGGGGQASVVACCMHAVNRGLYVGLIN